MSVLEQIRKWYILDCGRAERSLVFVYVEIRGCRLIDGFLSTTIDEIPPPTPGLFPTLSHLFIEEEYFLDICSKALGPLEVEGTGPGDGGGGRRQEAIITLHLFFRRDIHLVCEDFFLLISIQKKLFA